MSRYRKVFDREEHAAMALQYSIGMLTQPLDALQEAFPEFEEKREQFVYFYIMSVIAARSIGAGATQRSKVVSDIGVFGFSDDTLKTRLDELLGKPTKRGLAPKFPEPFIEEVDLAQLDLENEYSGKERCSEDRRWRRYRLTDDALERFCRVGIHNYTYSLWLLKMMQDKNIELPTTQTDKGFVSLLRNGVAKSMSKAFTRILKNSLAAGAIFCVAIGSSGPSSKASDIDKLLGSQTVKFLPHHNERKYAGGINKLLKELTKPAEGVKREIIVPAPNGPIVPSQIINNLNFKKFSELTGPSRNPIGRRHGNAWPMN